jgi:16S rRNA (guanine(966)-N(2))-methyltransferase RsmD
MSLRIQSGTARGRLLKATPKGLEVRPILARIRKSLFDILRPRMEGALFLDIFAGTGTVGLEALSNGARRAVFVDVDRNSLRMVETNVAHLGFAGRAEMVRADASRDLKALGGRTYDIIFLGPPYKDEKRIPLALSVPALTRVAEARLAGPDTWVILQRHENESLEGLDAGWEMFRENVYGDTLLSFFRRKEPS